MDYGGEIREFNRFLVFMNSVDPDIKFTVEINWEVNEIMYLDLKIQIVEQGYLQANLYVKPNAKN